MRKFRRGSGSGPAGELIVELPATLSGDVATEAARLMARAEAMGLIDVHEGHALDMSLLSSALDALLAAGIGRQLVHTDDVTANPGGALELLNLSVEASPHPATEWQSVQDVLGAELTMALTGVSSSSLRRYTSGERETPDAVAFRLHYLAMLIADLFGSYNRYGVRRWMDRPRKPLGGRSPRDVLGVDWTSDSPAAAKVADLARSLTSLGAT